MIEITEHKKEAVTANGDPQKFNSVKDYAPYKESHIRSVIKGITWRIIATTTTILITYLLTSQIGTALKVGAIEFVGKIFLYYAHERLWQVIPRGTIRIWLKRKFNILKSI